MVACVPEQRVLRRAEGSVQQQDHTSAWFGASVPFRLHVAPGRIDDREPAKRLQVGYAGIGVMVIVENE